MSYTNQYQYYPIEEHEKLIQLVAKNQMAGIIYMTIRQKSDYNTGEINFNMVDFKQYFDITNSTIRKHFQRAVELIEKIGLIKKLKTIQRRLNVIVLAHCHNSNRVKPVGKVSKTEKNLTPIVAKYHENVSTSNQSNSLQAVSKTECLESEVCLENVTQNQLRSYIDTMILDENLQNKNIEDGDSEMIPNSKPFEKFTEFKKQSLENYSNEISKEYKDICNKYNLSDTEANHVFSDFIKASKVTNITNPLGYFTKSILNYIRNGHTKQKSYFMADKIKSKKSSKKSTSEIKDFELIKKIPSYKRTAEQQKIYDEYYSSKSKINSSFDPNSLNIEQVDYVY